MGNMTNPPASSGKEVLIIIQKKKACSRLDLGSGTTLGLDGEQALYTVDMFLIDFAYRTNISITLLNYHGVILKESSANVNKNIDNK